MRLRLEDATAGLSPDGQPELTWRVANDPYGQDEFITVEAARDELAGIAALAADATAVARNLREPAKGRPEDIRLLREKIAYALRTTMGISVWTESSGRSIGGVHAGGVLVVIGTCQYDIGITPREGP